MDCSSGLDSNVNVNLRLSKLYEDIWILLGDTIDSISIWYERLLQPPELQVSVMNSSPMKVLIQCTKIWIEVGGKGSKNTYR